MKTRKCKFYYIMFRERRKRGYGNALRQGFGFASIRQARHSLKAYRADPGIREAYINICTTTTITERLGV